MDRTFLVPLASALALGLTSGCSGNGIVGDWLLVTGASDTNTVSWPQVFTETYDGVTYTQTFGFLLTAQADGRAAFGQYYEGTSSDGSFEREEYLTAGAWNKQGDSYELAFPEEKLDMTCTVERSDMRCDINALVEQFSFDEELEQYVSEGFIESKLEATFKRDK